MKNLPTVEPATEAPATRQIMLEVHGLCAFYGQSQALHGLDFALAEAGIITLLGANGAGKTTTLRALCGTVRMTGEIRFDGKPIAGRATEDIVRLGIAHVPEGRGTFTRLTVEENLQLGAMTRRGRAAIAADIEEVYSEFPRLKERRRQQAGTLSGGEHAGHENTLPVTVDEMLYHTRAVMRAEPKALVIADMPFLSYQVDLSEARRNAGRLIKDGGAAAVKLEGGEHVAATIRAIVDMDIPVMGHIGLTPQSIHRMGGYRVQGKTDEQAERLLADARAVEAAGAFALVLEGIPQKLAARITGELAIPTIGIGAGPHCDGQVLVIHDILGLCEKYSPNS